MIIPEDPRYDRYIVQPVVEALLDHIGQPARVETLMNPHVRGVDDAIAKTPAIIVRYPQHDVFVLALDRDGDDGRARRMEALQARVRADVRPPKPLVWCLAEQEIETWLLAAQWPACHRAYPKWTWSDVRTAPDVKERYFQPFFTQHRNLHLPGQGRAKLMLGLDIQALMAKCPELSGLRARLVDALGGS